MNNITSLPKGFVLYSERYQYTITKVIGRGANGYVYLATLFSPKHNASCQVALKEWASQDCCQRLEDMSILYPKDLKSEILYRNFMDDTQLYPKSITLMLYVFMIACLLTAHIIIRWNFCLEEL